MFPATTQASKDTPKEERRRVPSYDESIQGHPNKKEGKERKERDGTEEEEDRCSQLRTNIQGHTSERGVNLSIAANITRDSKLRPLWPRTPCQTGWQLRPLRSRYGMSQL